MYSAAKLKIICEHYKVSEESNEMKWRATPDLDLYDGNQITQPFLITPSEDESLTVAVQAAYQSVSDVINKLNAN